MAAVPADALDGEVLDRAQQFCLSRERKVRHLVEKERAALSDFELPPSSADAGGRALLDAE
jgi:hypothetical protein